MSKKLNRSETRKPHSWWWDSHISPKSSKWMADSLEEMELSVKRMLKLIEGDGDSFAKKADMYYQKRPELISLVEDFYRMYRSLAERYDNLTGELRKNIPSELQSHSSGISDATSEQLSPITTPDRKPNRRRNAHRAAGFDFFLGSAGGCSNDPTQKDGISDSDSSSDDVSYVSNYSDQPVNGQGEELHQRVIELEIELRDATEKIAAGYEEQLKITNGKLKLAEEEIARLKREHGDDESMKFSYNSQAQLELAQKDIQVVETDDKSGDVWSFDLQEQIARLETNGWALDSASLIEILKIANRRLRDRKDEIARLELELENDKRSSDEETGDTVCQMSKDVSEWNTGLEADVLTEEISKTGQNSSGENERLRTEISKVTEERAQLEVKVLEWELRGRSLEEEMERLRASIAQRGDDVEALNKELHTLKQDDDKLVVERDLLKEKVETVIVEVSRRDDRIVQMEEHMKNLHMEQVELLGGAERGRKVVEELGRKVKELEEEVERQRVAISNSAEEKREAIRQLCFSLEHYRNGYQQLRQAFTGRHKSLSVKKQIKRFSVLAS